MDGWQQAMEQQRRMQIDAALLEILALGASPTTIAVLSYECGLTESDVRQLLQINQEAA